MAVRGYPLDLQKGPGNAAGKKSEGSSGMKGQEELDKEEEDCIAQVA